MTSFLRNVLFFYLLATAAYGSQAPAFVGSERCAGCHEKEHAAWIDSHHSWAWREPTAANVLGDFDNAAFAHKGFRYRFLTEQGAYFIVADGPEGNAIRYPLKYVAGVTPLQQYLVETKGGRLQALDVAWDTEQKRWYHLYPDEDTSAGNGMHWGGSYKNWNARCAECHATAYQKNYDPLKDRYQSRQAEIGVGCEACHGPGEAHVAWAANPPGFDPDHWGSVDSEGLLTLYRKGDAASQINLCVPCHSRREPLGADSPPPGAPFDDHYRLSLIRDGFYFADGQIHDEVYVYGSFLQSKMYAAGVKCTNCHDAHSYALHLEGNAICTQCHNPGGNPAFPTLAKANYDSVEHHFHPPGSESARCTGCHMPERDYMVIDGRRDHGFRVPRPDLSEKLATPDVCTGCHKDQTTAWATQQIRQRFADSGIGSPHFAEVFAAADQGGDADTAGQLVKLAVDTAMPAIVRASALQRLRHTSFAIEAAALHRLQSDKSPLVRAALPGVLGAAPEKVRMSALEVLLDDPIVSVRIEAAKAALALPASQISAKARASLSAAMRDWQASLRAKADFPEAQMVIGGAALTLRNLDAAVKAFEQAVAMDPQLTQSWIMLARIHAALGDRQSVQQTLVKALQKNPEDLVLRQALSEMGGVGPRKQ